MSLVLKNKNLNLEFHTSKDGYQGTRFVQIGKLVALSFRGTSIVTSELQKGFSKEHGAGFYNEFDIDTALGYVETEKGDWFHKIGVGLLKKDDEVYDFSKKYECIKPALQMKLGNKSIAFSAIQKEYNGYAYEMRQTYHLGECGFSIEYALKNTGQKPIITAEYNHNFLQINQASMGPSYQLNFPTEVEMTKKSTFVNPNNVVDFTSKRLRFQATPKSDFFISDLHAGTLKIQGWELIQNNVKIKAITDFTPSKMNIWGAGHVISPELFAEIEVVPGNEKTWNRSYEFEQL